MTHARPHDRRRFLRQILLVPAVVIALMTAAAPAAASRITASVGAAHSARTAGVVTKHASARRHRSVRFQEFGRVLRKVG